MTTTILTLLQEKNGRFAGILAGLKKRKRRETGLGPHVQPRRTKYALVAPITQSMMPSGNQMFQIRPNVPMPPAAGAFSIPSAAPMDGIMSDTQSNASASDATEASQHQEQQRPRQPHEMNQIGNQSDAS